MPLQFLLVSIATLPVAWALSEWKASRRHLWRAPVILLFVLCCIGYPSQSGFAPRNNRSQMWDAIHLAGARGSSPRYKAVTDFSRELAPHPGIVLSNIDPVYLNALLPSRFVAAPIDKMHSYAYSRAWVYGEAKALQLIHKGLALNLPVYALRVPASNPKKDSGPLPSVEGYTWRPNPISHPGCLVLNLVSNRKGPLSLNRSVVGQ